MTYKQFYNLYSSVSTGMEGGFNGFNRKKNAFEGNVSNLVL